jgi:hypothetical protein
LFGDVLRLSVARMRGVSLNKTTPSPLQDAGYVVGYLIGIGIIVGAVVFAIIAAVKAFTRRTTGWIVAGSIGGVFLAIPVLIFMFGLISAFTTSRQGGTSRTIGPTVASPVRATASPPLLAPPSTTQTVRGEDRAYTVTLPAGWTFKRHAGDFDILASRGSLYVGVIAEEASLGTPETIAKIARDKLRTEGTDLRWNEPTSLLLDSRSWLQFVAQCKVENIPVTYQFYVYAGDEGTYQIVGWTTQNLYDRDAELMRNVMRTFHFPQ